jgi:hypothetical protein
VFEILSRSATFVGRGLFVAGVDLVLAVMAYLAARG